MVTRREVEVRGLQARLETQVEGYPVCRIIGGYSIFCDPDDLGFTKHAKEDGYWESWITAWVLNNIPDDAVCIDVGANMGYYTFLLAARGNTVITVEPQYDLIKLLLLSQKYNEADNVMIVSAAASDTRGEVNFTVPVGHGMNATFAYEPGAPHGTNTYTVGTIPLDEMVDELGLDQIDFVKIDAEGAERHVWRGMQRLLDHNPHCIVLMEWRWDRYEDPEAFGRELFDSCNVTFVDTDGNEQGMRVEDLSRRKHEDWMLVLRKR